MDKINRDGLYDIDMETYHGDCCAGPSVSGSGLVTIEQKTLAHYWQSSALNPDRDPPDSPALSFGRAAHAMILGEPEFAKWFVISPFPDFRTKEARAWRDTELRTIVTVNQLTMIRAMSKAIAAHPLLRQAFTNGAAEQSLIWKDPETGIWLKSRPDWLPSQVEFVPNYKTAANGEPRAWAKAAFGLGYHQGAALTLDGLAAVQGRTSATYYFVVQEKEPPYCVTPILMKEHDVEWGRMLNRAALRKLARALDSGKWPGYSDGVVEVDMPGYVEKLYMDRHDAGEI